MVFYMAYWPKNLPRSFLCSSVNSFRKLNILQIHSLFELKSGMTIVPKHAASLNRFRAFLEPNAAKAYILSAARGRFPLGRGAWSLNWLDALGR